MEYQGIIFDFNGTLFFDNDKHVKAWNEISKILRGKEITLEELHTKLNGTPNIQNILYFFFNIRYSFVIYFIFYRWEGNKRRIRKIFSEKRRILSSIL